MVEDRSADTLIPIINKKIRKGTLIQSDKWKGYNAISQNETVNHSQNLRDPETGACTNHIEATWHALKKSKLKAGGFKKTLIAGYFAEFIYRRKFLHDQVDNTLDEFISNGIKTVFNRTKALERLRKKQEVSSKKRKLEVPNFDIGDLEQEKVREEEENLDLDFMNVPIPDGATVEIVDLNNASQATLVSFVDDSTL